MSLKSVNQNTVYSIMFILFFNVKILLSNLIYLNCTVVCVKTVLCVCVCLPTAKMMELAHLVYVGLSVAFYFLFVCLAVNKLMTDTKYSLIAEHSHFIKYSLN